MDGVPIDAAILEAIFEAPPSQLPLDVPSDDEDDDAVWSAERCVLDVVAAVVVVVMNMASRAAPEPKVFVLSIWRFIRSSCISLRD